MRSFERGTPLFQCEPYFDDITCSVKATLKQPKGMLKEIEQTIELARKFNAEVVRPDTLKIDRFLHEDPGFVPWEWVEKANSWGLYTRWIPKLFGGRGACFPSLAYFTEEIASVCLGMANLIGVHYLGLGTLMATWNLPIISRLCRETIEGEKNGKPCLISLAITEPGTGTDTADADLIDKGNATCRARRVEGGYVINGTKVFISNGYISTWYVVLAYEDLKNPSSSSVFFVVKSGTDGFSLGRKEEKMGQKACPASEIIFEECFIPQDQVCLDTRQISTLSKSGREIYQHVFDSLKSVSRAGVCAMGTGVARGAFEESFRIASKSTVSGKLLINHEWVQCRLADMYKNVAVSRLLYVETNYANGLYGLFKMLQSKPNYFLMKYIPASLLQKISGIVMDSTMLVRIMRKLQFEWHNPEHLQRTTGWGSLAKFAGTDAGIRNCQIALTIIGQAGLRHDNFIEKHLRDAKLLQIYEGPNEVNRLDLFKNFIGRSHPSITMYED
jgi:acyl-CoA dehydrogenase